MVLHLRSLIGGRIRRASSVVSHVFNPNDIRHAFGMYHYARYIRELRPYDLIYVREAVHRERHEGGADRQRLRLGRTWSVSNAQALPNGASALHTRVCRPQYFAQRTPTCSCVAYQVDGLLHLPLIE